MSAAMTVELAGDGNRDRESEILDGVLSVLAGDGIGGVTMRAVARAAGVSLGLASYYFDDKTALIGAALRRIGEHDLEIVRPGGDGDPVQRLRLALGRVADDEFLRPEYLALRLQLWSMAPTDPTYAAINGEAQRRYLDGLVGLLTAARPDLVAGEVAERAAEILVIQNGIWLTAVLIDDRTAIERSVARTERIAFAPPRPMSPDRSRATVRP